MSWRKHVSQQVQDDLDEVCNTALQVALHILSLHGELMPFGVALGHGGGSELFASDPHNAVDSRELVTDLYDISHQGRADARAFGVVCDVTLTDGQDAIHVAMEHETGFAIDLIATYSGEDSGGGVAITGITASSGRAQIWP